MAANILKDRRLWLVTIVFFVILLIFFDRNNFIDCAKLKKEIRELHEQKSYYLDKIRQDSILLENLKDNRFLEQFARENYLMKKNGETVFIVVE